MPIRYSAQVANTAFNTANDFLAIYAATNHSIRIVEINLAGNGTASAANILKVSRFATVGVTPTNGITGKPFAQAVSLTATALIATAWATQPTGAETILLSLSANANGGVFRWVAPPYGEVEVPGGGLAAASCLSFRPLLGSSNMTLNVIWDEF